MRDPYEVLEINRGASREEIQKAYRRLVKKYHPDQYRDHPLAKLAEEKMAEINEAYEYLMKNGGTAGGYRSDEQYQSQSSYYNQDDLFRQVRININRGNLNAAEQLLDQSSNRSAEWYFLKGIIFQKKGWYSQALSHLQTAVNMDPGNSEYQNALYALNNSNRVYRERAGEYGGREMDICRICECLICTDCCCECMGSDFITCC